MAKDYAALAAQAASLGKDMTVASTGGGEDFEPPKAGPGMARFVGFYELGKQKGSFKGVPNVKPKVRIVFELIGKNHPPRELEDGRKIPHLVSFDENDSLNEKARYFKLFQRMNYAGKAQHIVGLLGEAFKVTVIHREYKRKDGKTGIAVELYDKATGSYTIMPPRAEIVDEDTGEATGEYRAIKVGPALTPLKAFLWELSDKEDWDALFIEGEYPERKDDKGVVIAKAKSKNVLQNTIKAAVNFNGSPIYNILLGAGAALDLPEPGEDFDEDEEGAVAEKPTLPATVDVPTGADADDALNDIV
jgi:hypothetical protein